MAEQTEKIILELTLSSQQLLGELGKVKTRQRELQAETKAYQKDLDRLAEFKLQGSKEYKELELQIAKNSRELVGLSREAANLNKNLDATEAAAGSYNALAAATAVLQKNLKEAVVGVNITQEAYDELNAKVKQGLEYQRDFARGSGDMRALVGAYKEELGPSIEAVATKLGVANDSLAAMQGLLKELKGQQASISPVGTEAEAVAKQIEQLEAQIEATKKGLSSLPNEEAIAAVKSLTALRAELEKLTGLRETLEPGTEAMGDLNNQILAIRTTIQQAEGKIDEFGERVQKNAKKEDIDTMADAFGGLTAAISTASLFMGDNTDAAELEAKAMRAVAVAQNLRAIQIGIASAKDAAAIVLTQAKNVLLRQETAATVAQTTATAGQATATVAATVATGAQAAVTEAATVATSQATVAQTGLNVAMRLNPIGLVITAIIALIGGLTLLYNKFKVVRDFLSPLIDGFMKLAGAAADALGLSDSAAEKAVSAQQKIVDAIGTTARAYDLEAKRLELAGAAAAEYRAKEREGLVATYNAQRDLLNSLRKLRADYAAEGKKLSDEQSKQLLETKNSVLEAGNALGDFDLATRKQLEAEAKQRAENAKKAREEARKLLQEQAKLQQEQLGVLLGFNKIKLDAAQAGSSQERTLLLRQAELTRQQELAQYGLTLGQKKLINAQYQAEVLKINTDYARQQNVTDLAINRELLQQRIAAAGEGTQAQLQLRRQLVAVEYQLELAGLDNRKNNIAQELQLKQQAKDKLVALAVEQAQQVAQAESEGAQLQANSLRLVADAMLAGLDNNTQAQVAASQGYLNIRLAAMELAKNQELASQQAQENQKLLLLGENEKAQAEVKAQGAERRKQIEQQYSLETLALQQETATKAQQLEAQRWQAVGQTVQNGLGALASIQESSQQAETNRLQATTDAQLRMAGNDAKKREKIQAESQKQRERLEKEYAEKRRRLSIVQALINGALAVTEILRTPSVLPSPFAQIVKIAEIGFTVATTAAQVVALNSQKFAKGGRAKGPSHQQGGIGMYHRTGAYMGEMEGDEIVLTKAVYQNPFLRGLASTLNQLAGGAPIEGASSPGFTQADARHLAAGGVVTYDPAAFGPGGSSSTGQQLDIGTLAQAIGLEVSRAVANLPAPQVAVSEITEVQNRVAATEAAADL